MGVLRCGRDPYQGLGPIPGAASCGQCVALEALELVEKLALVALRSACALPSHALDVVESGHV